MKLKYKTVLTALLCFTLLFAAALTASAAEYTLTGANGEITLPLPGLAPGAWSSNCWEFAQTVYEAIWGERFSSDRGTPDDLLKDVDVGGARAITAENTRAFITEAAPGAVIRISTYIDGDDNNGRFKHSMILLQKDDDGFTVYEGSVNGRVRIKYYTWDDFAGSYFGRNYGYYKYIKWPGAVPAAPEDAPVTCMSELNVVSYTAGDVDFDGVVTTADARIILRSAVALETVAPGTAAFFAADVDCDGVITTADSRTVLRSAVNLEFAGR